MSPQNHTRRRSRVGVGLVVFVLAVLAVVSAASAIGAGAETGGSTTAATQEVTNVTATVSGSNLTVTIEASNVTEVDVQDMPANWTVRSHRDDFGTYVDQVADEGRVLWLWPAPVPVNVSVTLSALAEPTGTQLTVTSYDGTTPSGNWSVEVSAAGEAVVSPPDSSDSDDSADSEDGSDSTDGSDSETDTEQRAEESMDDEETADDSGPGFSLVAALLALGLFVASRVTQARTGR